MPNDEVLTAPPPAYTPPRRRQGEQKGDSSRESYFALTQSYASIWNDCAERSLTDQVSCFTYDVSSYHLDQAYTTLDDPKLSLLATIHSVIGIGTASADASTSTGASPSPSATVPTPAPANTASSSTATATTSGITSPKSNSPSSSSSSSHTGAIIGGVIAGVVLILLAVLGFLLYRRRTRKSRAAPSAEFMHMARGGSSSPILSAKHAEGILTPPSLSAAHGGDRIPLARQSSLESDDRPPAFTPGSFSDPVYEKVQASAALREAYEARDVEGGYKD